MRYFLGLLCLLASTIAFAQDVGGGPFLERVCEHRIITQHKLTKEGWLEIVNEAEKVGQFEAAHAASLRVIIEEAYSTSEDNLPTWVEKNCKRSD